jgi:hypothetical protein
MKKNYIQWTIVMVLAGLFIGGGFAYYMYNKPHPNIQAASADYEILAEALVTEYLEDPQSANNKYLSKGNAKVLLVSGTVLSISTDMNHNKVVLLKENGMKAGVSCTFMEHTNENAEKLKKDDSVTIKGIIRAGARYDEDLEFYEDVILEKCDVYHPEMAGIYATDVDSIINH